MDLSIDSIEKPTKAMKAVLAGIDERFMAMLRQKVLDPTETLFNLKKMLQFVSETPDVIELFFFFKMQKNHPHNVIILYSTDAS